MPRRTDHRGGQYPKPSDAPLVRPASVCQSERQTSGQSLNLDVVEARLFVVHEARVGALAEEAAHRQAVHVVQRAEILPISILGGGLEGHVEGRGPTHTNGPLDGDRHVEQSCAALRQDEGQSLASC